MMKLTVVTVDKERKGDVVELFERAGVTGYSLIPSVLGSGQTGKHLGSRAFPGDNAMLLALVPAAQLETLQRGLRALEQELRPGQGLMAFKMDAEQLL
ncbi:MAG: PG0541 family transporter-associated protein [Gemmatimonadales bacterium]